MKRMRVTASNISSPELQQIHQEITDALNALNIGRIIPGFTDLQDRLSNLALADGRDAKIRDYMVEDLSAVYTAYSVLSDTLETLSQLIRMS